MRIVVVDDDPLFLRLIQKAFESAQPGTVVLAARSLTHGCQVASQLRAIGSLPDLFLIDSSLGDGTGMDMLCFLKNDETLARVPAVLVTASLEDEAADAAKVAGASACYQKPAGFDKLVDLARRLLALARVG